MKIKVIILIISVLLGDVAMGQSTVKPNTFPLEPSPNNNNFEVYSQKNGINRRATLASIRDYIIQGLQYVPGPVGPPGPPNSLTIGTVTQGISASASITGTPPNQVLNLVFPYQAAGPGTAPDLVDEGKTGNIQGIGIVGGTGITIDVSDADNDPTNELQTLTISGDGAWSLSGGGGSGQFRLKERYTYRKVHANTSAHIWATDTTVTIVSNDVTGELVINVPDSVELYKVYIEMRQDALDASNNYFIKLAYEDMRPYNTNIANLNIPSVHVGRSSGSVSRSTPIIYAPDGSAGVDVGISEYGTGDGSDLEIVLKDFLLAPRQFVSLIF